MNSELNKTFSQTCTDCRFWRGRCSKKEHWHWNKIAWADACEDFQPKILEVEIFVAELVDASARGGCGLQTYRRSRRTLKMRLEKASVIDGVRI
jgi:hypothetical protein